MADYEMNYAEINKQHAALTAELDKLGKALTDMRSIEEDLLSAGKYQASDKEEIMSRFNAYIEGGNQLHSTGMSNADTLSQVATRYQRGEQG